MCYASDVDEQEINRRFEKLEHQNELLQKQVESDMKVSQAERREAKAESDSALERLRTTMADYNAKMEERSNEVIKFTATMSGVIVVSLSVILGGLIALLQYFK